MVRRWRHLLLSTSPCTTIYAAVRRKHTRLACPPCEAVLQVIVCDDGKEVVPLPLSALGTDTIHDEHVCLDMPPACR